MVIHFALLQLKEMAMRIAVLGKGPVGSRLAMMMHAAKHTLSVGSRTQGGDATSPVSGVPLRSFSDAADGAELIIVAVPGHAAADVVAQIGPLDGKVVIDATNLLGPGWAPAPRVDGRSNAEHLQALAPRGRFVKCFNTIFADLMTAESIARKPIAPVALLCGDDASANERVAGLARDIGFALLIAGPLHNARYLESMAHLHIQIATVGERGTEGGFAYV
jgi:8-hydroxy-5-deazaflavin:NADPH oxidoreductase